jgi:acyl-CoA thioesterase I
MKRLLPSLLFFLLASIHLFCAAESQTPQKSFSLLVLGDSLSAAYGIDPEQGWVNLLKQELTKKYPIQIINASVSGETSSGGLARLPTLLKEYQPNLLILELGANDGLRGLPLKILEQNLQTMLDLCRAQETQVILAGMQIPPNYGPRYTDQFKKLFPAIAEKNQISLIPFLLEGVAGNKEFMQEDGLHPTANAQPLIMKHVLPILEESINGL